MNGHMFHRSPFVGIGVFLLLSGWTVGTDAIGNAVQMAAYTRSNGQLFALKFA